LAAGHSKHLGPNQLEKDSIGFPGIGKFGNLQKQLPTISCVRDNSFALMGLVCAKDNKRVVMTKPAIQFKLTHVVRALNSQRSSLACGKLPYAKARQEMNSDDGDGRPAIPSA